MDKDLLSYIIEGIREFRGINGVIEFDDCNLYKELENVIPKGLDKDGQYLLFAPYTCMDDNLSETINIFGRTLIAKDVLTQNMEKSFSVSPNGIAPSSTDYRAILRLMHGKLGVCKNVATGKGAILATAEIDCGELIDRLTSSDFGFDGVVVFMYLPDQEKIIPISKRCFPTEHVLVSDSEKRITVELELLTRATLSDVINGSPLNYKTKAYVKDWFKVGELNE